MTWKTMGEWNKEGMRIIKGSRCLLRDPDGVCLFQDDQVIKKEVYNYPVHERSSRVSSGYYAQPGGNYQKHDYTYEDYEFY